jgi:NAD(P)-dependent dehydrogenase (short-subunit alcohol dehydrogenase family)
MGVPLRKPHGGSISPLEEFAAQILAGTGVTVNALAPGYTATEFSMARSGPYSR